MSVSVSMSVAILGKGGMAEFSFFFFLLFLFASDYSKNTCDLFLSSFKFRAIEHRAIRVLLLCFSRSGLEVT